MARQVTPKKRTPNPTNPGCKILSLENYPSNSIHCPQCGARNGHKLMGKVKGEWTARCIRGHRFTKGLKSMPSLDHIETAQKFVADYKDGRSMAINYLCTAVGSITVTEAINRGII